MTGDMAFLPGCQVVQLGTTTEPLVVVVGVVMVLLGRVGGDNGVNSGVVVGCVGGYCCGFYGGAGFGGGCFYSARWWNY